MEIMVKEIVKVLILIGILSDRILGTEAINITLPHFKVYKSSNRTHKALGKWQERKVTSRQYEVFNILWRKTKIFAASKELFPNVSRKCSTKEVLYNKTSSYKSIGTVSRSQYKKSSVQTHLKLNVKPSTPSYIEFYYLDDLDNKISRKYTIKSNNNNRTGEYKFAFLHAPFQLFRRDDATPLKSHVPTNAPSIKVLPKEINLQLHYPKSISNKSMLRKIRTTAYDRIRFFEIYDSDTPKPSFVHKNKGITNGEFLKNKDFIYLDEADSGLGLTWPFNLKLSKTNFSDVEKKTVRRNVEHETHSSTRTPKILTYSSQTVAWSDYPFVAVYVYEPEQIRCDCAAISSHWLVGAATCLYRYNKKNQEDQQSAFVTYCSSNWRLPGRIAYVSQCILHPQFHPKNYTRRQLFNIGAIQVVNSLSNTCNGWHPISLMSHNFVAEREGSPVTALGWGLDRYDTRFTVGKLPGHSLMVYQGSVYSNFCPGNIGYSEAKRLNEASIKNVYCLSLPPYITEEHDPVHGSLLLMGGKLMALYSQEERRRWGEQSALYTGIWHLIPWLNDIAKEEEDLELFDTDMYKYSK